MYFLPFFIIAAAKVSSQGDFIIFLNNNLVPSTGKSLLEAPIFASTNLQYDDRLFIEEQVQYVHENSKRKPGENMLCTEIVSDIQNNFCTQHVLLLFCKKKSF